MVEQQQAREVLLARSAPARSPRAWLKDALGGCPDGVLAIVLGGGWRWWWRKRADGESAGCPDFAPALEERRPHQVSSGRKAEGRGEPRLPRPCPGQPAFPLMISDGGGK